MQHILSIGRDCDLSFHALMGFIQNQSRLWLWFWLRLHEPLWRHTSKAHIFKITGGAISQRENESSIHSERTTPTQKVLQPLGEKKKINPQKLTKLTNTITLTFGMQMRWPHSFTMITLSWWPWLSIFRYINRREENGKFRDEVSRI